MSGKLIDIFGNCKSVAEEQHLAGGEVRSLAFGDNNTVMVVELGLSQVVSRKAIAQVEKQIAKQYGLERDVYKRQKENCFAANHSGYISVRHSGHCA